MVGRRVYGKGGHRDPKIHGFTPIISLTKSTPYGDISPYCLKSDDGRIMENIWQAAKVYEQVPATTQYRPYSRDIIWQHPSERHANPDGSGGWLLTPEYLAWRNKLMAAEYPIRYPVGKGHRHKCLFSAAYSQDERLGYVESRKNVYFPLYDMLVRKTKTFEKLQERHRRGENLLIIEVDGPHQESLDYYRESYGLDENFIIDETMLCSKAHLMVMLNDPKHPFGHGYCLAMSLMNWKVSNIDG